MTISRLLCWASLATLVGCAHPMMIAPDIAKIERPATAAPIAKNVGYYIAPVQRTTAVTTPGGGGDKVTYSPYKDFEPAFYKMLGNVFTSVTVMDAPSDAAAIAKNQLSYVITPTIVTTTSSSSSFTWPPTDFTFELSCNIVDATGQAVTTSKAVGQGKAEFSEFKKDFSLTGKLATTDALLKMQQQLLETPALRQ
jgi:hypothetical protein